MKSLKNTTIIQGSILGGETADRYMESQHVLFLPRNISCLDESILFFVDLVEGRYAPSEPPPQQKLIVERAKCVFNVAPQQKYSYNK